MLTYAVPENLQTKIAIGQIVEIPLRNKRAKGMIAKILKAKPDFETLEIGRIRTPALLSKKNLDFLQQISEYNFCSYSKVLPLFLPEKLWNADGLPPTESFLELCVGTTLELSLRGAKQKLVIELLQKHQGKMPENLLREQGAISTTVIKNLLEKGIIKRSLKAFPQPEIPQKFRNFPEFTAAQKTALKKLEQSPKALLCGPAGSGKTLLALKQIADVVKTGGTALFLMPERFISESTTKLLAKYFPPELFDLYHSFLSEGEKMKIWWRVREGRSRIIFGTRAALFLPFENLKLVILDEEQDTSFKSDQTPRYHTRTAAEMLAEIHTARFVLQSATPSLESFARATGKEIELIELTERFGANRRSSTIQNLKFKIQNLPPIHIVDLRHELAARNFSPLSNLLQQKIRETLRAQKQIILFLNRRGKHSALVCRQCGTAILCGHCKNRSTLHEDKRGRDFLLCHHCGHIDSIPLRCPRCDSSALKGFGMGTQELEQEVKKLFPAARIRRADRDSTALKNSGAEIFAEFGSGQADILIGTQIVSKGLDFPNVGLVGIVLADTALHLPDFRAAEYAFQLLTQVAGRTGRQGTVGEVILQTYLPEHPAVQYCQNYDFAGFWKAEMKEREALFLPPFSRMIRLIFVDHAEKKALMNAKNFRQRLEVKAAKMFPEEHFRISLAPALTKKKFNKFHYHIFLLGKNPEKLLEGENLSGIRVDRDPVESF